MTSDRMSIVESLSGSVARGLLALPPRVQNRLAGGPPPVVDGQELDPQMHLLAALRERRGNPELSSLSPAQARLACGEMRVSVGRPHAGGRGTRHAGARSGRAAAGADHTAGRAGRPAAAALLLRRWLGRRQPGHPRRVCRRLADAPAPPVTVGYRLRPSTRSRPRWRTATPRCATGRPTRRVPGRQTEARGGGDSAGGNLAAVAAGRGRRRPGSRPGARLPEHRQRHRASRRARRGPAAFNGHSSRVVPRPVRRRPGRRGPSARLAAARRGPVRPAAGAGGDRRPRPAARRGQAYADALAAAASPSSRAGTPASVHGFVNMGDRTGRARHGARARRCDSNPPACPVVCDDRAG